MTKYWPPPGRFAAPAGAMTKEVRIPNDESRRVAKLIFC